MTKGGLLEGFPVHLLTENAADFPILVMDSFVLGRLQVTPVPTGRQALIAVSPHRECLEQTREAMKNVEGGKVWLVQAKAQFLPFRPKSLGGIIQLLQGECKSDRSLAGAIGMEAAGETLRGVLTDCGWLVEVIEMRKAGLRRDGNQPHWATKARCYYIRPSTDSEYFVTCEWVPSASPFKALHLGKLRSIRLAADRIISRLGIRPLYNGVSLLVHTQSQHQAPIERWIGMQDNNGSVGRVGAFATDRLGLFVKAGWKAFLMTSRGNPATVKFPLSTVAAAVSQHHADSLDALNADHNLCRTGVWPKVLDRGLVCGQAYWTETRCQGYTATKYWWIPGDRRKKVKAGFRFLLDFHQSSSHRKQIDRHLFDALMVPHVTTIERQARSQNPLFDLTPLLSKLWEMFRGRSIPLVHSHGDFWLANLLSDGTSITGVLDWDAAARCDWPLLDLLHLILFQHKRRAYRHFGSVLVSRLMAGRLALWERAMIREYCSALEIPSDLWIGFVTLYWVEHASLEIRTIRGKAELNRWVARNVIAAAPAVLKQFTSEDRVRKPRAWSWRLT